MIPGNIQKKHILEAISRLDQDGVPNNRMSRKFDLLYNEKRYPPKYLISVANEIVNRYPMDPESYSGGVASNLFLMRLGYSILDKERDLLLETADPETRFYFIQRRNGHQNTGRCSECKNTIMEMLREIYGLIMIEHKLMIPTNPDIYKESSCYPYLKKIYDALIGLRGFNNFNRSTTLKPCDIYVAEHDFVVEIDEQQHFSAARGASLALYPSSLKTGFSVDRWATLCADYKSVDNDPPYRDEQRAWYDTLRDFLPLIDGFNPTVRIHTGDFEWCSLNPKSPEDRKTFITKMENHT